MLIQKNNRERTFVSIFFILFVFSFLFFPSSLWAQKKTKPISKGFHFQKLREYGSGLISSFLSPSGKALLYLVKDKKGNYQLWLDPGKGKKILTLSSPFKLPKQITYPFSPSGEKILFFQEKGGYSVFSKGKWLPLPNHFVEMPFWLDETKLLGKTQKGFAIYNLDTKKLQLLKWKGIHRILSPLSSKSILCLAQEKLLLLSPEGKTQKVFPLPKKAKILEFHGQGEHISYLLKVSKKKVAFYNGKVFYPHLAHSSLSFFGENRALFYGRFWNPFTFKLENSFFVVHLTSRQVSPFFGFPPSGKLEMAKKDTLLFSLPGKTLLGKVSTTPLKGKEKDLHEFVESFFPKSLKISHLVDQFKQISQHFQIYKALHGDFPKKKILSRLKSLNIPTLGKKDILEKSILGSKLVYGYGSVSSSLGNGFAFTLVKGNLLELKKGKRLIHRQKIGLWKRSKAIILLGKAVGELENLRFDQARQLALKSQKIYGKTKGALRILQLIPLIQKGWQALQKRDLKSTEKWAKEGLKVYPHSNSAKKLLQRVEDIRKSGQYATEAQKKFKNHNFTKAKELALEAKQLDEKNSLALKVLKQLDLRQKKIHELLQKGKAAFSESDFDVLGQCIIGLKKLYAFQEKEVQSFLQKIEKDYFLKAQTYLDKEKNQVLAKAYLNIVLQISPKKKEALALKEKMVKIEEETKRKELLQKAQKKLVEGEKAFQKKDYKMAIRLAKEGLELDKQNKKLQDLLKKSKNALAQEELAKKNAKIKALYEEGKKALSKKDFRKAFDLSQAIWKVIPNHPQGKELLEKGKAVLLQLVESFWKEKKIEKLKNLVSYLEQKFPKEGKSWKEKAKALEKELLFTRLLQEAQDAIKKKNWEGALKKAEAALLLRPKSKEAQKLQKKAAIKKRSALIQQWKTAYKKAFQKKDFAKSLQIAKKLQKLFPSSEWRKWIEVSEKELAIQKTLSLARKLRKKGKLQEALKSVDQLLEKYPQVKSLLEFVQKLDKEIKARRFKEELAYYIHEAQEAFQRKDYYTCRALCLDGLALDSKNKELSHLKKQVEEKIQKARRDAELRYLEIQLHLKFEKFENAATEDEVKKIAENIREILDKLEEKGYSKKKLGQWQTKVQNAENMYSTYIAHLNFAKKAFASKAYQDAKEAMEDAIKVLKKKEDLRFLARIQRLLKAEKERKKGKELLKEAQKLAKTDLSKAKEKALAAWKLLKGSPEAQKVLDSIQKELAYHNFEKEIQKNLEKNYIQALVAFYHAFQIHPKKAEKLEKQVFDEKHKKKIKNFNSFQKKLEEMVKAYYQGDFKQARKALNEWKIMLKVIGWDKKAVQALVEREKKRIQERERELKIQKARELLEKATNLLAYEKENWKKKVPKILDEAEKWAKLDSIGKLKKIYQEVLKIEKAYTSYLLKDQRKKIIEVLNKKHDLFEANGIPTQEILKRISSIKIQRDESPYRSVLKKVYAFLAKRNLKKALQYLRKINSQKKKKKLFTSLEEELREVEAIGGIPKGMVYIPSGAFSYGAFEGKKVFVPGYFITITEVTNRSYYRYIKATKKSLSSQFEEAAGWKNGKYEPNTAKYPVRGITYGEALEYAKFVGMRLPTEYEWEKAARGPFDLREYPWGNEFFVSYANLETGHPVRVGSKPKDRSLYGVMDMAGNVSEWVEAAVQNQRSLRLIKGGNFQFLTTPPFCNISYRYWTLKKNRYPSVGMRLVMDLTLAKEYFRKERAKKEAEKKNKKKEKTSKKSSKGKSKIKSKNKGKN